MPLSKRNEFLDASDSDEGDSGHEYADIEDSRTSGLERQAPKRRKFLSDETQSPGDYSGGEANPRNVDKETKFTSPKETTADSPPNQIQSNPSDQTKSTVHDQNKPGKPPKKSSKSSKRGVIYLSRIPPFMRPATVRTLLSSCGQITQLFLTPEAPTTYAARKSRGGNKKRSFIDGWVEFQHKRHAKACVDGINGQIVGGKKGGWYRDDVWNAKYLRGFRWDDLMAGVRQEDREREERVRVGIAKDKREREAFLRDLESAKIEQTRERKRKKKHQNHPGATSGADGAQEGLGSPLARGDGSVVERRFRQNDVEGPSTKKRGGSDDVNRVLAKIF